MTTIVGKKRNPRTLDPALFLGKTWKNTPEVKLVEKFQNILKNSQKIRKISVRHKEEENKDLHLVLAEESGKILNIKKNTLENSEKYSKRTQKNTPQKSGSWRQNHLFQPCMLKGHSLVDRGWGGRAQSDISAQVVH